LSNHQFQPKFGGTNPGRKRWSINDVHSDNHVNMDLKTAARYSVLASRQG
jgi:hypothetical protein